MRDDLIKALEDTLARPSCKFLRIDRKAAAELLTLIKSQAHEDAQPVTWLHNEPQEDGTRHLVISTPNTPGAFTVYTRPAPDALRTAVAKLEKAKITDDPAEVFMLAMEALAVLQAEQKEAPKPEPAPLTGLAGLTKEVKKG